MNKLSIYEQSYFATYTLFSKTKVQYFLELYKTASNQIQYNFIRFTIQCQQEKQYQPLFRCLSVFCFKGDVL